MWLSADDSSNNITGEGDEPDMGTMSLSSFGGDGSGMSHGSMISMLTMASAGVAALSVVALTALQSDSVSRRFLSPDRLEGKRHAEFVYRWTQALEKAKLQLKFYMAGGTMDTNFAEEEELVHTIFLTNVNELQPFVEQLVNNDSTKEEDGMSVRIGRIGTDSRMNRKPKELYVWLYQGRSNIYQVPLRPFGILLANAMDDKITSTTFCFVADASANAGSRLIVDLVKSTKTSSVCYLQEPLWMVQYAVVAQQGILGSALLERLLFALCRLEALHQVTAAHESTMIVTLPGQATAGILMPLLQKVFPDDRHVFCYTSCIQTIEYANTARQVHPRAKVPESMYEAMRFANPVSYTTPLRRSLSKSTRVTKAFMSHLSKLPLHHADIVESWMDTVDTFLTLKEEEKTNGYLPFVFKMDNLLAEKDTALPTTTTTATTEHSKQHWALMSLLQYILGSRSREIPTEHVDAAQSWLQDYQPLVSASQRVSLEQRKAIQNAIFEHKSILIENKTLLDTVQPAQHWTLKEGDETGCYCCGPEDDEEHKFEQEEPIDNMMGRDNEFYVDGKTTFAFDPTRFNMKNGAQ